MFWIEVIRPVLTAALIMVVSATQFSAASEFTRQAVQLQIRHLVEQYVDSIESADLAVAAKVWSKSARISFIHPRGTEVGWEEVAQNFYHATMSQHFSKRALRLAGDPRIDVFDDSAVVVFAWDFVATRRDNGKVINTRGRESQIYMNILGEGWRLVHVHYSGMPITLEGQGF